jgi:predicted ester cyclase
MTVEKIYSVEDTVITRWHGSGTNDGEMMGMPPTGRRAEVTGITIDRFDSAGRITEIWTEWDNLGFITQLGVAEQALAAQAD